MRIQELPGIGVRYDIDSGSAGKSVSVVIRNSGGRDLYVFESAGEEPTATLELNEVTARKIGAVLAGLYFTG